MADFLQEICSPKDQEVGACCPNDNLMLLLHIADVSNDRQSYFWLPHDDKLGWSRLTHLLVVLLTDSWHLAGIAFASCRIVSPALMANQAHTARPIADRMTWELHSM